VIDPQTAFAPLQHSCCACVNQSAWLVPKANYFARHVVLLLVCGLHLIGKHREEGGAGIVFWDRTGASQLTKASKAIHYLYFEGGNRREYMQDYRDNREPKRVWRRIVIKFLGSRVRSGVTLLLGRADAGALLWTDARSDALRNF
jgi:hypothetical protein